MVDLDYCLPCEKRQFNKKTSQLTNAFRHGLPKCTVPTARYY